MELAEREPHGAGEWIAPRTGSETSDAPEREATANLRQSVERWLAKPEELSANDLLEEMRKDGAVWVRVGGGKSLEDGAIRNTVTRNIAMGRHPEANLQLFASEAIHGSLNTVYENFPESEFRLPEALVATEPLPEYWQSLPGVPWATVPAVLYVSHPGVIATHYGISTNLRKWDGTPLQDVAVTGKSGNHLSPDAELTLDHCIVLVQRGARVHPETGVVLPGDTPTKEEWEAAGSRMQTLPSGRRLYLMEKGQGFAELAVPSEVFFEKKLAKAQQNNRPIPKQVLYFEGASPHSALKQFRREQHIPEQLNQGRFQAVLGQLQGFGYEGRFNRGKTAYYNYPKVV